MKQVLVAMSGGVDSSVAAALLVKQGYFVAGAYMKNFSPESWEGLVGKDCPWEQDLADAKVVCEKLGIEFRSFNFEKEYQEKVIEYFFSEYAAGRTPNPDVMCNKEIKFGLFLEKAMELGFDYVATGHYARIRTTSPLSASSHRLGRVVSLSRRWRGSKGEVEYELLKGLDPKKDQSYFLYTLNQEKLPRILFPIGEYTKKQVRQMAKEFGLPNWDKKDSQGLCFVGHIKLREFLKQRLPERVGEIVDPSGRVIGNHPGAWYYTIGQRHGLGIGGGEPYYVAQKDVISNQVMVAQKNSPFAPSLIPVLSRVERKEGVKGGVPSIYSKTAPVGEIHWINAKPQFPLSCQAKIRYQQPDQECTISLCEERSDEAISKLSGIASSASGGLAMTNCLKVQFLEPQFAIAPGQSIVFYNVDQTLGGGIIETKTRPKTLEL